MGELPDVLHNGEQAILRRAIGFAVSVLVENADSKRRGNDAVRNSQDFVEGDEVFHLDGPVRENEPFELDAERVGQLAHELLVRCSHVLAVVLIVVDPALLEVRVEALLQGLVPVSRYLQVQHKEGLV